jgi:hypothetical protein
MIDEKTLQEWTELYNIGWGSYKIAKKYGISIPTVQKYLRKVGIFNGIRTRDARIKNFDGIAKEKNCIVIKGDISDNEKRCDLRFSLGNLDGMKIVPRFDKRFKKVLLIPNKNGRKLSHCDGYNVAGIGTYIPNHLRNQQVKIRHKKISVYFPLAEFNISEVDTILDLDGRKLAERLVKMGWKMPRTRLTFADQGDLLIINPEGKKILMEITKSHGLKNRNETTYLVLGKILKTKVYANKVNASTVIILNSTLKRKLFSYFNGCVKYLNVNLMWTDFKENWIDEVISNIEK